MSYGSPQSGENDGATYSVVVGRPGDNLAMIITWEWLSANGGTAPDADAFFQDVMDSLAAGSDLTVSGGSKGYGTSREITLTP